jgi:drug/metabolite transporter (DMT)-like permease
LSVIALKYTYTSVAATLNSTSPIFILPLVAFFLKERVSAKAMAGALMAVGGIGLYFFTL